MLKTILVDDNPFSLQLLYDTCCKSNKISIDGAFTDSLEALAYTRTHSVDFAFLDIEMPILDGLNLAKLLRKTSPGIVIIFVTVREDRCLDAFRIKADYYIRKPFQSDDIVDAIDRAELLAARLAVKPFIHTFGRFDVFYEDHVLHFPNAKSKELFALCIDRQGGDVTMEEAIDVLWPEKPYDERVKALYRKAVMSLRIVLNDAGISHIFDSNRGLCHVHSSAITCDYYDFLAGKPYAIAAFRQEYMFEYSWAEATTAKLCAK